MATPVRHNAGAPLAIGLAGAGIMALAIAYGAAKGDFGSEGRALMGMPWGVVSLVDVYVGLMLFSAWAGRRERSRVVLGAWIMAFIAAGNLATCCYVLKAAIESRGDGRSFWLGKGHEIQVQ
jgi:hypothetical protein